MALRSSSAAYFSRCFAKVHSCRILTPSRLINLQRSVRRADKVLTRTYYVAATAVAESALNEYRYTARFDLYKSQGAMQLKVISPTWKSSGPTSAGPGICSLDKSGVALLEFATPVAGTGSNPGDRRYNWQEKENFALSAFELGILADPDPSPNAKQTMFHDPNKGNSKSGGLMKTLNIAAGTNNSWFISLQVKKGDATKKINVSLNRSEFATLQVIAKYLIPHVLGFDVAVQGVTFSRTG